MRDKQRDSLDVGLERMLRDPAEEASARIQPYTDPVLKNSRRTYIRFLRRLLKRRLLNFYVLPFEFAGIFCLHALNN